MSFRALLAGAFLAGALGACAVVDPVDQRYDTVGRSLAKARNESIFLNLIRASHDYPLAFTTISNVTPTMTNVSTFSLPAFSVGPPNCLPAASNTGVIPITCAFGTGALGNAVGFGNTTASNATTVSTNFSVSTQETASFYDGFLKPIDLTVLDYFIRQDYSRELLFWLFADSFQIGNGPKSLGFQYSPPVSYGCPREDTTNHRCFADWLLIAVLAGLTVEEQTIQKPSSSTGGGGGGGKSSSDSGAGARTTTTTVARFCFNPLLQRQAANQIGEARAAELKRRYNLSALLTNPAALSPQCGSASWNAAQQASEPQGDTFNFTVGGETFRVYPRSAYGVFEFLGNLLRIQRENLGPLPTTYYPRLEVTEPIRILTVPEDPNLITVIPGNGACFSHTWFYDGDYCVPEQAANTKRIFSLLAQLTAITTSATDLSITPLVRIVQ